MIEINIDENPRNADWTKRTWAAPPYKSEEFLTWIESIGWTLEHFKTLPMYEFAVENGLIVDDEWTGEGAKEE